ncbi:hypothetical protein DXG01_012718 [Tephrocybe rancida]|nr:hypothetical protein DXG01_012718 [Tephrocybe rancida]
MSSSKGLGVSSLRAYTLLLLFSTAQLLDIVNVTAPVIALPDIANDLGLVAAEGQWVVNAYTLTFGAFLLTGGRFSAVYGPKALFITGFTVVGLGSIINGFAVNGPMLFVIRALQGIGAAITIPSAITMIVLLFPNRASTLLFVFAVTEGNVKGWASKQVLPPLIISILLLPVFGEYAYMNVNVFQMSEVFQQVWKVSPINAAVRIIPFGLTGLVTTFVAGAITPYVSPRWILSGGQLLVLGGAVLLAFAETKDKYWPIVFPGFIIGACGIASGFVSANIAMLRTPMFKPGVNYLESTALLGAIFNANLQIGSSVGLAIVTAITTKANHGDPSDFRGYRAGWWFIVGLAAFEAILAAISLRGNRIPPEQTESEGADTIDAAREKSSASP